ncbi:MAG: hypothetical protein RL095_1671 [Verrucomicrobiota bacterium]|jgi:hypothetical protein
MKTWILATLSAIALSANALEIAPEAKPIDQAAPMIQLLKVLKDPKATKEQVLACFSKRIQEKISKHPDLIGIYRKAIGGAPGVIESFSFEAKKDKADAGVVKWKLTNGSSSGMSVIKEDGHWVLDER